MLIRALSGIKRVGLAFIVSLNCRLPNLPGGPLSKLTVIRCMINEVEHIIEMNTISRFFTHALAGTLPSGRPMRSGRISDSLVRRTLQGRYSTMPPQMPGGGNSDNPIQRIFNAIGSQANNQHMVITSGGLNMAKSAVGQFTRPAGVSRQ